MVLPFSVAEQPSLDQLAPEHAHVVGIQPELSSEAGLRQVRPSWAAVEFGDERVE
jgi:hypothetical protein